MLILCIEHRGFNPVLENELNRRETTAADAFGTDLLEARRPFRVKLLYIFIGWPPEIILQVCDYWLTEIA